MANDQPPDTPDCAHTNIDKNGTCEICGKWNPFGQPASPQPSFREDLAAVINRHSKENGSNTPDFILAEMLTGFLNVFDAAMQKREKWYGHELVTVDDPREDTNSRAGETSR